MSDMPCITLDTLGRLAAHGYGLNANCLDRAAARARANFNIDLAAVIAERGADAKVVGLLPPPCPRCGSTNGDSAALLGHLEWPRALMAGDSD
jgi:hypothetical protein